MIDLDVIADWESCERHDFVRKLLARPLVNSRIFPYRAKTQRSCCWFSSSWKMRRHSKERVEELGGWKSSSNFEKCNSLPMNRAATRTNSKKTDSPIARISWIKKIGCVGANLDQHENRIPVWTCMEPTKNIFCLLLGHGVLKGVVHSHEVISKKSWFEFLNGDFACLGFTF